MAKVGRNESCPCGSGKKYKKCCGTNSGQRATNPVLLPRHVVWRREYRARRYLERLSREELEQRAKDVFVNLHVLDEQLLYSPPPINNEGQYWMIMWTHVLEEFHIRYGPYPAGFTSGFMQSAALPEYNFEIMPKATSAAKTLKSARRSRLFKFGQHQYLRPALERGSIRVAPASSYSDSSLNPAIRDEELQVSFSAPASEVKLEAIDEKTGKSKGLIRPSGNVTFTLQSPTNYYVYCMASAYALRLYGDFEADACLVIHRPKEFNRKLIRGFEAAMPGWKGLTVDVNYFDPLNFNKRQSDVFALKHFRYSYQKETRLVWLPPAPEMKLDLVYLELGDLSEYCELISLRDEQLSRRPQT